MSKPIPHVSKYMTTTPEVIASTEKLVDAQRMMQDRRFRHLPVVDGGKLVGLLSDRDVALIFTLQGVDQASITVADALTPKPYTVAPDAALDEVVSSMAEQKIGSAVVLDNHKVVGIFTATDALTAFAELLHTRLAKA